MEYFSMLLNVRWDRSVVVIRDRGWMMDEFEGESGKATGLDGISGEMLLEGGVSVVEWMLRLFNLCLATDVVPQDWQDACVVPLYKGKGDKFECGSYRGISLLSVVGEVYGRILMNRTWLDS